MKQFLTNLSFARFLFCFLLIISPKIEAQQESNDSLPRWTQQRKLGVLLNQSDFNNWLAGGNDNFSGTLNFDYKILKKSPLWEWSTTLDMALGYAQTMSENFFRKTEDRIELNSILQRKSKRRWSFSSTFNLKTQHTPGYLFTETEQDQLEKKRTSDFFSPAYMQLGIGLGYAHDETLAIQLNPLAARLIAVDKVFTRDLGPDQTFFGVQEGKSKRWEMSASLSAQSKLTLFQNGFLIQKINLITNYIEEAQNVDLDYTGTIDLKVNEYLSALLEVQLRYDNNALADLQYRQVFGLAVAFPF